MKIVINTCYGGFGLSKEALALYNERSRTVETYDFLIKRDDPILVEVVEQLGEDASDRFANLKVVEIPDDVQWGIEEYDGNEWIAEKHRTWK
jgi:hypothetical protein